MGTACGCPQGQLPRGEECLRSAITETNKLLAQLCSRVWAVVKQKGEVKSSHIEKIICEISIKSKKETVVSQIILKLSFLQKKTNISFLEEENFHHMFPSPIPPKYRCGCRTANYLFSTGMFQPYKSDCRQQDARHTFRSYLPVLFLQEVLVPFKVNGR